MDMMETTIEDGHLQLVLPCQILLKLFCILLNMKNRANSCNGILHMCDGKSRILCNRAAQKCIDLKSCKYTYFKRVLNEMLNNEVSESSESLPDHKNIRGKDFYK